MTSEETAWVAGILEGEACFDYNRTPKYPRVRVEMVDEDVILRLHALVGGRITRPTKRNSKPQWSSTVLLSVNGKAATDLMSAILPWMSARRAKKIEELLN